MGFNSGFKGLSIHSPLKHAPQFKQSGFLHIPNSLRLYTVFLSYLNQRINTSR